MDDFLEDIVDGANPKDADFWSSVGKFTIEILKVVLIAVAIVLPVRFFLVQPFYVKGASMEPNFFDYEYLLIDEVSYNFNDPVRGEVVVMHDPLHPSQFFIKRVIGLPGDTVDIKDGSVKIMDENHPDGVVLAEDYLGEGMYTRGSVHVTLTENQYFVLGDNRDASLDSRVFGPVDEDLIVGRTWVRAWPFDRLTTFEAPDYNI